jgi:hypothetical protein
VRGKTEPYLKGQSHKKVFELMAWDGNFGIKNKVLQQFLKF